MRPSEVIEKECFFGTVSRGIELDRFEIIRAKYGGFASWAVWDSPEKKSKVGVGNISVLNPLENPKLLDIIHTDLILVGLNGSRPMDGIAPFSNFHDQSVKGMDYKLRHAAYGTALWGAYMSDVIKNCSITKSNELLAYMKKNPIKLRENLNEFRMELSEVGSKNSILVPMGLAAANIITREFGREYKVFPIMHYSHYIGIEDYCRRVWEYFPKV